MKVEFMDSLFVEEINDDKWRIIAPFRAHVFNDNDTEDVVVVPALFETDFASVPRVPIVFELYGNKAHRPSVLHDYLYSVGGDEDRRHFADRVFLAAMIADGIDSYTAQGMYEAVRLCGASYFNKIQGV